MRLRFQCPGFARYKAVRKPKCGCVRCNLKYFWNRQKAAPRKKAQIDLPLEAE